MSFKESVIIPYEMFKKCQFPTDENPTQNILDENLPSDVKMKLYTQAQHHTHREKTQEHTDKQKHQDYDFIVQLLAEKNQPFAQSILNKMRERSDEVSWNKNLELVLDGKTYVDSNIIELFKYIMKNLVITRHSDVPRGAIDFMKKLYDIGVPKSWIKATMARESTRRPRLRARRQMASDEDTLVEDDDDDEPSPTRKRSAQQEGQGIPWIIY